MFLMDEYSIPAFAGMTSKANQKGGSIVDKVIVTVATTGSRPTKEQNPNLPTTPEEIAGAAYECYNEGASIVHVHVRDTKTRRRSMGFELYAEVVERLRAKCDMIINLTTGAGGQLA